MKTKVLFITLLCLPLLHALGQQPDSTFPQFSTDGVTFGYRWSDKYLCYPVYNENAQLALKRYQDYCDSVFSQFANGPVEDHYVPIPLERISGLLKDDLGDTVMIMWSGRRYVAVIRNFAHLLEMCSDGLFCELEPLDSISNPPRWEMTYLALRQHRFYRGPIITYQEYRLPDSLYYWLNDSLRTLMCEFSYDVVNSGFSSELAGAKDIYQEYELRKKWEDWKRGYHCHFERHFIKAFGVRKMTVADSLFVVSFEDSTYSGWFGLYYFFHDDSNQIRTIIPLGRWDDYGTVFKIDSAFDLNDDGIPEYLVEKPARAVIHIFSNGKFVPVCASEPRGCG